MDHPSATVTRRAPAWLEAAPRQLLVAAAAAALGALAGREGGLVAAAAVVTTVLLLRCWLRQPIRPAVGARPRAGSLAVLCAIPAALGAVEVPRERPSLCRTGPVRIDLHVDAVRFRDRARDEVVLDVKPWSRRDDAAALRCVVRGGQGLRPGDRIRGVGHFDAEAARRALEHGRSPRVITAVEAMRVTAGGWSWRRWVSDLRARLEAALLDRVPGTTGALLAHLVLGRGPRLPESIVDAHRVTGLAHLLAVSGAHASMLAWMIAALFRAVGDRDPWTARGYRLLCSGFLLVYGSITGWDPPIFRALAAFLLVVFATGRGRRPSLTVALVLPALLTAWLAPQDLGSVSFCLSYAAVIGLGASGAFDLDRGFARWSAPWRASFWAALATAPWTLAWFGQLAPWTVLATPLLTPLVAWMLAWGVLAALTSFVAPALADLCAAAAAVASEVYVQVVLACTALPGAPVLATWIATPASLAVAVGLGLIALVRWPHRRGLAILCVLACLPHFVPLPHAASQASRPADRPTAVSLHLLAVGHGQAALVEDHAGRRTLVDCGTLGDPRRAARAVHRSLTGPNTIDLLVLSHADFDHVSGVRELLRTTRVDRACLAASMRGTPVAGLLRRAGLAVQWVEPGAHWSPWPTLTIWCPGQASTTNEASLWVELRRPPARDYDTRGGSALVAVLPGDAGRTGISQWLARAAGAAVLVLPHHGRGDPDAMRELLEATEPLAALVSNRADEPETALAALARAAGIATYDTGTRGDLLAQFHADGAVTIRAERPRRLHRTHADPR